VASLRAERVAKNEAFFRDVNEHAERRSQAPRLLARPATAQRYMCECGDADCTEVVTLAQDEYRSVRAHPRRFLLLDGHEAGDLEDVVERHEGYVVVEKPPGLVD
jgi:hypothetical protein